MSSSSTMQLSTYVLKAKVFKRTWGVILIARLPKSHVGRRGDHAGATFHCGHWCIDTFASLLSRSFLSLLLIHRNKMNKRLLLKNTTKHPVLIVAYTWLDGEQGVFPFTAAGWTKAERKMRKRRRKMMKPWIKVRRLWAVCFRSGPWRPSDPQRLHAVCWGLWGLWGLLWGSTEVAQKSLESMCVWQNSAVLQQCLTHWRSKWLGWHWSCHWWYVKPLSLAVQKQAACFALNTLCGNMICDDIITVLHVYRNIVYIVDLDWPILAWLLLTFA